MKKISYYYLELIKMIVTSILFFAVFGFINDHLIQLITGYSFPDVSFFQGNSILMILFIVQYIGVSLFVFVCYKNTIQFIGFQKQKQGKKLTPQWTKKISFFALFLIVIFYMILLF
ncbi:hypothetical protein [Niallia sp. 01092]|uniref:hypothetical protein n=1 Tax=unclassified Niallia TaxID=2837522 RepID=UPI003FCF1FD8